ncbi:MAG: hypothetical protein R3339_01375 [Thermodesulfobacteriota bacterium]|nr:hypothetical protein [Thermodesulfobacteriota bacterium]
MTYSAKGLFSMGSKKGLIISAILTMTLSACASIQNKQAAKTEDVLVKAGFKKVPADTPEQLAHLKTIPQRKLVSHKHKDGIRYIYADANLCKCMYVGDRDAYQSYKHILLEKEIKDHEHVEGEPLTYQQMDWDLWGDFTSATGY